MDLAGDSFEICGLANKLDKVIVSKYSDFGIVSRKHQWNLEKF